MNPFVMALTTGLLTAFASVLAVQIVLEWKEEREYERD